MARVTNARQRVNITRDYEMPERVLPPWPVSSQVTNQFLNF